ncbi:hypothetical protein LTR36_008844 [Oleoguttula mirabilis]|uniref:ubiquitinyl hydrolase 1 n=1 Tax=Oleoguttula mirabilis TaxID=1507867 RepID=A0AAV9J790_9PEZI|nr:hypothetical protein LTR36_008844 [Oleoguttula mirabilis]
MSSPPSGPGKTAPKLLKDFLLFDPVKSPPKRNILTDHPPPVGDGPLLGPQIGSCKHEYTTKTSQSVPPPLDTRPDSTTKYKVAAVCKKCRIHADVRIDYARSTNPCPNSEYLLHHFQRLTPRPDDVTGNRIRYAWQCSAPQCQASLQIDFRVGRLTDHEKDQLTNTEQLKRRYDVVSQQDPSREGIRQATPMEALVRLRKYVRDSLNPQHGRRTFPANNKRFMEAFGVYGQDCKPLLERLGFKYAVRLLDVVRGGRVMLTSAQDELEWTLPSPSPLDDRLNADGSSQRELLEDVDLELLAWMFKISSETGSVNPAAADGWPSADRDVERTLAAQSYQRHVTLRRVAASNEDLPYFASLGALPDFSDSLIEFAYDRQAMCDPDQLPYYFECLQVVTQARGTEQLQMKTATLSSQDVVSRRDLSAAYRFLNIPHADASNLSDERIIELFQAQQPDLGVIAAEEARQALNKIGTARQSQLLINASRQSVDTYEDALSWLGNGASKDMSDDTLLAILAAKTSDNRANEEIGQKAIATIARSRRSNLLNNWLLTGSSDSYTMSVDEALRHLNIDQPVDEIDQTILPVILDSARVDRPGERTEKAIAAIQQHFAGKTSTMSRSPATWPVGLTSHGNTCYLNSLLQYYFSIKPLRDIILNYDHYKLDTSVFAEKQERVGNLHISMVEIKGGQRFAEDLTHLFERMIKESGSAVKPEEDLVCRAFLPPQDYALLASNADGQAPTVNGDLESAVDQNLTDVAEGPDASTASAAADARHPSNASSTTLQASVNGDNADVSMTNGGMPPTPPASPGQKPVDEKQQPSDPPPLPPRRPSMSAKETALAAAKKKATEQQDVAEVHDSIMFRLRSGMLPSGMDDSGEQTDALRDMYAIGMTETEVIKGVTGKPTPQIDSSLLLKVPTEPSDLYSSLDAMFDLQPKETKPDTESYKSIRSLPPLLQISMPRIGWDTKRGGTFKSEEFLRLEDELYMDRYYDTSHPQVLERRKRCWGWRRELQALKTEQKALSQTSVDQLDGPTAISETANYLNHLQEINSVLRDVDVGEIEIDEDLSSALASAAKQQQERLTELQSEIDDLQKRLDFQFADLKSLKYRLAAVFIHRGTHGHGHYWAYIHDFTNNIWRMYNDEHVSEVTKLEDIFEAKTWNQGTPTYAVYVQDDRKEEIVQPVCRAPERAPTPQPSPWTTQTEDVEMQDGAPLRPQREVNFVDPKMVEEGGQNSWDTTRQVAEQITWEGRG